MSMGPNAKVAPLPPTSLRSSTRRLVAFADSGSDGVSPNASAPIKDQAFDDVEIVNSDAESEALLRVLREGGDGKLQMEVDTENGDETALKKALLSTLDETLSSRATRRRNYRKLFRSLVYVAVYLVVLFLQRDPTSSFQVFESLSTMVPTGSANKPGTIGAVADVITWLGSLLFPAWNDPVCGDGVCQSPQEFPAFGRFGCSADCGEYDHFGSKSNQILVELTVAYTQNADTPPPQQLTFLAQTSWNLCFNSAASASAVCWYAAPQTFASATETVSRVLLIPDGNWTLNITAPYGNVAGSVTLIGSAPASAGGAAGGAANGTASSANSTLVSWSVCKARDSHPGVTPSPPPASGAGRRRLQAAGWRPAGPQAAARAPPGLPSPQPFGSFALPPPTASPAGRRPWTDLLIGWQRGALGSAPGAALLAELPGPGASGGWEVGPAPNVSGGGGSDRAAAAGAAAGAPSPARADLPQSPEDLSALAANPPDPSAARPQRREAVEFDLSGSGISSNPVVLPNGRNFLYPTATDVATGTGVTVFDWTNITYISSSLPTYGSMAPVPVTANGTCAFDVLYTVVKVSVAGTFANLISWNVSSDALGGKLIATSMNRAYANAVVGGLGSGYTSTTNGESWFIEAWCLPAAADAMAGPLRVVMSTPAAAASLSGGATLLLVNYHRCRLAPAWPLPAWPFPAAGSAASYSFSSLQAPCTPTTPLELPPPGTGDLSWNVLLTLSSPLPGGAGFTGFRSADAIIPAPFAPPPPPSTTATAATAAATGNSTRCPPGYGFVYFMATLPLGADGVIWHVNMITRFFPILNLQNTVNPLSVGVTSLGSFNSAAKDGLNEADPTVTQASTVPIGSAGSYCFAQGIYGLYARVERAPYRSAYFSAVDKDGVSIFAAQGVAVPSLAADVTGLAGTTAYFAVIPSPIPGISGSITVYNLTAAVAMPAVGSTPPAPASGAAAACSARKGFPLAATFAGIGVWHASDVSWRLFSISAGGGLQATPMAGSGYSPLSNRIDWWCLQAGAYAIIAYDNNVVSAANASTGWDGGVLFLTDPTGCIVVEATIAPNAANMAADIHRSISTFTLDGTPLDCAPSMTRRTAIDLTQANGTSDLGSCPYQWPDALSACASQSNPPWTGVSNINTLLAGQTANTAMCGAMCATSACDMYFSVLFGPMPLDRGCCQQEAGNLLYPFSLWGHHSGSALDYGLIPTRSAAAATTVRSLVQSNRVISGVLVTQRRYAAAGCANTGRFAELVTSCSQRTGPFSTSPYGVDPMFVPTSTLFDDTANASALYKPSELNAFNTPFGFFPDPLPDGTDGAGKSALFSVFFDVNMGQRRTEELLTRLTDGFFFDDLTAAVTVELVTFNSHLSSFSSMLVALTFTDAGEILVNSRIDTVIVELYSTTKDYVRAALELWLASVRGEVHDARLASRAGMLTEHLTTTSTLVDVLNFGLSGIEIFYWLVMVFGYLQPFSSLPRVDVYADVASGARPMLLAAGGRGLRTVQAQLTRVQELNRFSEVYIMLHGLNIVFLLARILKLCHFQPRLGIITRTLAAASGDLGHYLVILSILFIGASSLTYLVFGPYVAEFSSLGHSFQTTFNMLAFQDSSFMDVFYNLPTPLNYPALIYYWSFALLMTIIMLNFALAIIVDAFAGVKAEAEKVDAVPREVASLFKYWIQAREEGPENAFPTEADALRRVKRMAKLMQARIAAGPGGIGGRESLARQGSSLGSSLGSSRGSSAGGSMRGSASFGRSLSQSAPARAKSVFGFIFGSARRSPDASMSSSYFDDLLSLTARRVLPVAVPGDPPGAQPQRLTEEDLARVLQRDVARTQRAAPAGGGEASGAEAVAKSLARQMLWIAGEVEFVNSQGQVVERPDIERLAGRASAHRRSGLGHVDRAGGAAADAQGGRRVSSYSGASGMTGNLLMELQKAKEAQAHTAAVLARMEKRQEALFEAIGARLDAFERSARLGEGLPATAWGNSNANFPPKDADRPGSSRPGSSGSELPRRKGAGKARGTTSYTVVGLEGVDAGADSADMGGPGEGGHDDDDDEEEEDVGADAAAVLQQQNGHHQNGRSTNGDL